eukprot:1215990-Rhodomonas_salina.2
MSARTLQPRQDTNHTRESALLFLGLKHTSGLPHSLYAALMVWKRSGTMISRFIIGGDARKPVGPRSLPPHMTAPSPSATTNRSIAHRAAHPSAIAIAKATGRAATNLGAGANPCPGWQL